MISIQGLIKRYDQVLAVNNLSLEIPEGQVMGLLGPNGAGKSTTLRILTGFLEPSGGKITVDGLDVQEDGKKVRSIIGYLPESSPLYQDMLVFDYLDYIARMRGIFGQEKAQRIGHLAWLCGIREVMHQSIASLSKGYRQRVGLALAMMADPKILILDEPTSGLDPNQIGEIRSIIKEIGKEKTVIFSTHILSEAEATCDRVVIINKGEVAADGTVADLKRGSSGRGSLQLTLKGADSQEALGFLSSLPGVEKAEEGARALDFVLTTQGDIREELYLAIKKKDWVLLELQQSHHSLEELFKDLTKGVERHDG